MLWDKILGKKSPRDYIEDQLTGKKYIVKTPTQVYNTLKKLKLFKNL